MIVNFVLGQFKVVFKNIQRKMEKGGGMEKKKGYLEMEAYPIFFFFFLYIVHAKFI